MRLPVLDSFGLVGERKALALLCLGFYATLFFLIGVSARTEMPEWVPLFFAMMTTYVVAFVAVGAEWFWGRWFASGIGYWGLSMAVMAFATTRSLPPAMVVFGAMHGLVVLCLAGERMAAAFDAQPEWRARYKIDDQGVVRLKKSVTRFASSLPAMVLFALAPRGETALALLALAVLGMGGVLLLRVWGLFALGAAGIGALALTAFGYAPEVQPMSAYLFGGLVPLVAAPQLLAVFAGVALLCAVAPFARPLAAFLARR
jgi:hypothetical protein